MAGNRTRPQTPQHARPRYVNSEDELRRELANAFRQLSSGTILGETVNIPSRPFDIVIASSFKIRSQIPLGPSVAGVHLSALRNVWIVPDDDFDGDSVFRVSGSFITLEGLRLRPTAAASVAAVESLVSLSGSGVHLALKNLVSTGTEKLLTSESTIVAEGWKSVLVEDCDHRDDNNASWDTVNQADYSIDIESVGESVIRGGRMGGIHFGGRVDRVAITGVTLYDQILDDGVVTTTHGELAINNNLMRGNDIDMTNSAGANTITGNTNVGTATSSTAKADAIGNNT